MMNTDDTTSLPAGFKWLFHVYAWVTIILGVSYFGSPSRFVGPAYQVADAMPGGVRTFGAMFIFFGVWLLIAFNAGKGLLLGLWATSGAYTFWAIIFMFNAATHPNAPSSAGVDYVISAAVPVAFVLTLRQWRRLKGEES